MKYRGKAVYYGFLIWLLTFLAAVAIFPVKKASQVLFDSIMPVVLTVCVVWFAARYFRGVTRNAAREGLFIGMLWLGMNLLLDWPLFSHGPMKMTLAGYFADIGLTYLIIPVVTLGAGHLREARG